MLTYSFVNISNESMYEYLYNCIKKDIISGILPANEKLPSKRTFARNHGISVITVENAYGQLLAEGYIYSLPKKGYFVSEINNQFDSKKGKSDLIELSKSSPNNITIDFVSNHTLPENFPFSIWAKIMRNELSTADKKLMTIPPSGGVLALRQAIAKHLMDFRGINVNPEQIIIGAGSEYMYGLIVQLLGHNKTFALENPGYKKLQRIYENAGAKVTNISMDKNGIKIEDLKGSNADIAQISPSHHFPTGIVMPVSRRFGLLEWANEKEGRYIIEDDYDSEFRLQGKPIPSLMSIDVSDKVIYFNTFTKSLASTIRISYMILPISLLKKFYDTLGFYSCTVSNFEQYALAAFINQGYFEKHINRMRNYYRGIRDELLNLLRKSKLANNISITEEDSGLHFLLTIKSDLSDKELTLKAKKMGIRISFLSDYFNSSEDISDTDTYNAFASNHTAIINYSGLSIDSIETAVHKLEEAWL